MRGGEGIGRGGLPGRILRKHLLPECLVEDTRRRWWPLAHGHLKHLRRANKFEAWTRGDGLHDKMRRIHDADGEHRVRVIVVIHRWEVVKVVFLLDVVVRGRGRDGGQAQQSAAVAGCLLTRCLWDRNGRRRRRRKGIRACARVPSFSFGLGAREPTVRADNPGFDFSEAEYSHWDNARGEIWRRRQWANGRAGFPAGEQLLGVSDIKLAADEASVVSIKMPDEVSLFQKRAVLRWSAEIQPWRNTIGERAGETNIFHMRSLDMLLEGLGGAMELCAAFIQPTIIVES